MAVKISGTGLDASTLNSGSITQDKIATGAVSATKIAAGAAVSNIGYTPVNSSFLVGQIGYFAMSTAPDGWLKANGQAVSRTTYSALFTVLGTTYGNGDGSTTFNVPDLRGEFLRSLDDGRGVDTGRTIGTSQPESNAPHTHFSVSNLNGNNGSQYVPGTSTTHTIAAMGGSGYELYTLQGQSNPPTVAPTSSHGVESRPRNVAVLACIKY